jgi:hypothetical protein
VESVLVLKRKGERSNARDGYREADSQTGKEKIMYARGKVRSSIINNSQRSKFILDDR